MSKYGAPYNFTTQHLVNQNLIHIYITAMCFEKSHTYFFCVLSMHGRVVTGLGVYFF